MNEIEISSAQARELTDRIRVGRDAIWEMVKQAYQSRAWSVLGYSSWDDYCTREFGDSQIRLPREERQEVVSSMREIGMSTRAIASATGMSQKTISRDVSVESNDSTESEPQQVTGTDGKTYTPKPRPAPEHRSEDDIRADYDVAFADSNIELAQRLMNESMVAGHEKLTREIYEGGTQMMQLSQQQGNVSPAESPIPKSRLGEVSPHHPAPGFGTGDLDELNTPPTEQSTMAPAKPKRPPLTDNALSAVVDLQKIIKRLESITNDDRFEKNKTQIRTLHMSDLGRAQEALKNIISNLSE